MYSQTEENYLKLLHVLANPKGEVSISELSNSLNVSLPTVNSMVRNLKSQGLVNYEKYRPISLTEKGKKEGAAVIRKHRLTEMFLVTRMGFGWEEVHDIAEQIEHIKSSALFERMDQLLGFPQIDPHGSPIPDKDGEIIIVSQTKLSICKSGEKAKVIAVAQSSTDFLNFLNSRKLKLGTILEILSVESFDGSMTVCYIDHPTVVLSHFVCEGLFVEQLN